MKGTILYKMTGSGNDFVVLDGRHAREEEWVPGRVAQVCDRRNGVGADGLVILTPVDPVTVRMRYFNSDGSHAALCGNAALCSTRLAALLEMAPGEGMTLLTDAGPIRTRCAGAEHLAELSLPPFDVPGPVEIEAEAGEQAFFLGTVGVPHLVVVTQDARAVDVVARGRQLRSHPVTGQAGANVNFVSRPEGNGAPWLIRTYERGVEAETLACGTGTVAAAFALGAAGVRSLPGEWETGRGFRLAVSGDASDGRATEAWLLGEGRLVFTGVMF